MINISCQIDPALDQPNRSNVKRASKSVFKSQKIKDCDVSLIFVSDEFLSDLKKKYFQKNHFTDVIAFRLNEYDEPFIEGEVYISLQRAKENSKIFNEPYAKEVSRLIIHGCLHLIGFEDKSKEGMELMKQMEEDLLKSTNWKNIFNS